MKVALFFPVTLISWYHIIVNGEWLTALMDAPGVHGCHSTLHVYNEAWEKLKHLLSDLTNFVEKK